MLYVSNPAVHHTCNREEILKTESISIRLSVLMTFHSELIGSGVRLLEVIDADAAVPTGDVGLQQGHPSSERNLGFDKAPGVEHYVAVVAFTLGRLALQPRRGRGFESVVVSEGARDDDTEPGLGGHKVLAEADAPPVKIVFV